MSVSMISTASPSWNGLGAVRGAGRSEKEGRLVVAAEGTCAFLKLPDLGSPSCSGDLQLRELDEREQQRL
jgi:hypothetical protein